MASKLAQFKSQVSSFRHSESSATDLIDRLWDIFNSKLDEFGKLITSTADLFDYDAKLKRTELLGAWNDWKIQVPAYWISDNDKMQEANSAASTGFLPQQVQRSRILALKSSAKSRASATTQNVWNRIEAVAASRPVPSSSSSGTQRLGAMNSRPVARHSVPWTRASSSVTRPAIARLQPPVRKAPFAEEFPSLPTVKPKERVVLNPGPARPVASWGSNSNPVTNVSDTPATSMITTDVAKGKGKKKGKTVLFHVG